MTILMQSHDSNVKAARETLNDLVGSFGFYPENSLIIRWIKRGKVVLTQRCDVAAFVSPEGLSQSDVEIYLEPGQTYFAEEAVIVICLDNVNPRVHEVIEVVGSGMAHANITLVDAFIVVGQHIISSGCGGDCQPHVALTDTGVSRLDREKQCASNPALLIDANEFPQLPKPESLNAWRATESLFVQDRLSRAGGPLALGEIVRLTVAMGDIRVRDSILWDMANGVFDRRLVASLLTDLLPKLDAKHGASIATCAAVCWWLNGNGAMANLCVNRAVNDLPGYSLAIMVRTALEHALPPSFWLESINELTRDQCLSGLEVAP